MSVFESVRDSIAYIEANLQQNIGVSDVARAVSYSQFYLSREFSRHTHMSLYDYIMKRKLTEAYKQLLLRDSRIIDVAFQFGFQSHEVFTRAFRKAFGENPSAVSIAKPMAFFESIDEDYLEFLQGLEIERFEKPVDDCWFCIGSSQDKSNSGCFLTLLSKEHLLDCQSTLKGTMLTSPNEYLSCPLKNLMQKIRIYHTDIEHAFRYFTNHFYNVSEMGSNYILIVNENSHIDILVPGTPKD